VRPYYCPQSNDKLINHVDIPFSLSFLTTRPGLNLKMLVLFFSLFLVSVQTDSTTNLNHLEFLVSMGWTDGREAS